MGKNLHSSTRSSSFLEYSNKRSFGVIYSDRAKGIGTKYYKARGLFKSKKYGYIHSDVNGAFNIGRLLLPGYFSSLLTKDMQLSPLGKFMFDKSLYAVT